MHYEEIRSVLNLMSGYKKKVVKGWGRKGKWLFGDRHETKSD